DPSDGVALLRLERVLPAPVSPVRRQRQLCALDAALIGEMRPQQLHRAPLTMREDQHAALAPLQRAYGVDEQGGGPRRTVAAVQPLHVDASVAGQLDMLGLVLHLE